MGEINSGLLLLLSTASKVCLHFAFVYFRHRVLVRAVSYTIHGLIPASCVFADRYNREEVVASLGREINLNPPLTLGQLPDTSEELLKLDQVICVSKDSGRHKSCAEHGGDKNSAQR